MVGVGLDAFSGDNDPSAENFSHFRFTLRQELKLLALFLIKVKQHLLIAGGEDKLFLVNLKHAICVFMLIVFAELLFHYELEVFVVDSEGVFALDEN